MNRARGPYAKGRERRVEILDRTIDVFAERGYARMTLRAVSTAIGISHGTVLHYFPSLESLLLAALSHLENQEQTEGYGPARLIDVLVSRPPGSPARRTFTALYTSLLGTSTEEGNQLSRAFFAHRFDVSRTAIAAMIDAGRADGSTPPGPDSQALAALVIAASDGLQAQWLLDHSVDTTQAITALSALIGDTIFDADIWADALGNADLVPTV